jgi:hypothetical protein
MAAAQLFFLYGVFLFIKRYNSFDDADRDDNPGHGEASTFAPVKRPKYAPGVYDGGSNDDPEYFANH